MTMSDGTDRRGLLKCMAWVGTGVAWTIAGGVPRSLPIEQALAATLDALAFVQISDSHIGFGKDANTDVPGTVKAGIDRIRALPKAPAFMLHTGDISHLSKPGEFDLADQLIGASRLQVFYVPGEHDMLVDDGASYLERYGKGSRGMGWYSFDHSGVHFVGLVNVVDLRPGGMGRLGDEQLEWLEQDLAGRSAEQPIVVFAHIPLWAVYPEWGWGTEDSARALGCLKRFGSVTVLNGHIHQVMQKVEGNVSFHTAMSTAFPQPAPGTAPAPGPMKVEPERLKSVLGIANVSFVAGRGALAIVDTTLSGAPPAFAEISHEAMTRRSTTRPAVARGPNEIGIDNFAFAPATLTVKSGTKVVWINDDDVPHIVVNVEGRFKPSPLLDTNQRYSVTLTTPGIYKYFCSLHPQMQGKIVVE